MRLDLLEKMFVVDGCCFDNQEFPDDTEFLKKSNVNMLFFTVPKSNKSFKEACEGIINIKNNLNDKNQALAYSYKELQYNIKEAKIIIVPTFQDPKPIENNLNLLRVFYKLGVRIIQLTYNKANYIGAGCVESKDLGLTDFGKELVKEMNNLGMIIDLSHCNYHTTIETIKLSYDPIIFSHANVNKITSNPRNKLDEEIKLMAKKGGVIGLTPWGPLCMKPGDNKKPILDDYLDHIDYVVNLVGIDYVGFGSDNTINENKDIEGTKEQAKLYPQIVEEYNIRVPDPNERHVNGFSNIGELSNVISGMQKRGYNNEEISKFVGGNFMRVIKEVWK